MNNVYYYAIVVLLIVGLHSQPSAEPEALTDQQMTDISLQKGIKTLPGEESQDESELLQLLNGPIPGTEKGTTIIEPDASLTTIELNNLENQVHEQTIQEQIAEQLFQQAIQNSQDP